MKTLWRSMPLRLALLLVLLFSVVSLLSLAASYAVTQRSFEQDIQADLRQDIAGFRAAPNAAAVALLVEAESRETDPNRLIISYVAPNGRLYGNAAIARDAAGFHIISLDGDKSDFSNEYMALTSRLYGGLLTIARSRAEIDALGKVFVNILWLSLIPSVLIALGGGLFLARRSKRHVDALSDTLDDLTTGNLAARVDMTPRWADDMRQVGDKLNEMAQAQETSVTALKQVTLDIAHDLKTPIQRVSVHLNDLTQDPENKLELVEKAQSDLASVSSVFQSLLQLAQVESGSPRSRFTTLNLNQIIETLSEVYAPSFTQNIKLSLPSAPVSILGDKDLITQALANLIENALHHAGRDTQLAISLENTTLTISDTGPGIPEPERANVLQRLYRLDRSRNTPGNGLGLSLVESVVKLHRGTLTLSDNAPGLRATITFPTP
jgi:signal transduction histidine kinase